MQDLTPFLVVSAGTGINAVAKLQAKQSPVKVLASGVVFGLVCIAIDDLTNSKLGTLLAGLFLFSSFLNHGVQLIDVVSKLTDSLSAPPKNNVQSGFTAQPAHSTGGQGGGGGGSW